MVNLINVLRSNSLLTKKEVDQLASIPELKSVFYIPDSHLKDLFKDPRKYIRETFSLRFTDKDQRKIKKLMSKKSGKK